ncbi:TetR/AcrR family transcriptional regulator [Umezawaea sp. Da 62-37]|uniref:TetR/AcrR family transcriptional regulator n=1 Tax=Umezawaea sp. Da 62-37 TaxID=3075927 RepID=UPI0028F71D65|nr:TetR/AcrR family transcriptional regulator [Umezawaea sp. Da 62-37]WNV88379.1 TetR/AcrR family transcriptional regulator [Umezawaea sp. Da 62-37]
METTSLRVYGGVTGQERRSDRRTQLLAAGFDLLSDVSVEFSVRGVCKHAGLTARYFYENFADRDALAVAVYDGVIEDIITPTLAAVAAAPDDTRAKAGAGLAVLVAGIREDPRRGRLLFAHDLGATPVVARRRVESTRRFVGLLAEQARTYHEGVRPEVAAELLVGGLAQVLTAWLDGDLVISEADLIERCTDYFVAIGGLV